MLRYHQQQVGCTLDAPGTLTFLLGVEKIVLLEFKGGLHHAILYDIATYPGEF